MESRVRHHWDDACDQARLTTAERDGLWQREILNDYVFEGTRRTPSSAGRRLTAAVLEASRQD